MFDLDLSQVINNFFLHSNRYFSKTETHTQHKMNNEDVLHERIRVFVKTFYEEFCKKMDQNATLTEKAKTELKETYLFQFMGKCLVDFPNHDQQCIMLAMERYLKVYTFIPVPYVWVSGNISLSGPGWIVKRYLPRGFQGGTVGTPLYSIRLCKLTESGRADMLQKSSLFQTWDERDQLLNACGGIERLAWPQTMHGRPLLNEEGRMVGMIGVGIFSDGQSSTKNTSCIGHVSYKE